jgi:acyl carrier protein
LTAEMPTMTEEIRRIVSEYGHLSVDIVKLSDSCDLYRAGLSSHASVNLMLALEDAFDLEFPEQFLRRGTFESVTSIREALEELMGVGPRTTDPDRHRPA